MTDDIGIFIDIAYRDVTCTWRKWPFHALFHAYSGVNSTAEINLSKVCNLKWTGEEYLNDRNWHKAPISLMDQIVRPANSESSILGESCRLKNDHRCRSLACRLPAALPRKTSGIEQSENGSTQGSNLVGVTCRSKSPKQLQRRSCHFTLVAGECHGQRGRDRADRVPVSDGSSRGAVAFE